MLGFAMRAGRVTVGTEMTLASVKKTGKDRARLVLIANTASAATKKKITGKCEFYGVEYIITDISASTLGERLGKLYAPSAVAITDDGFAKEIKECAPRSAPYDCKRDVTTKRKEVSDSETGDTYGSGISENNSDI